MTFDWPTFDWPSFINIVLSALIGVITSLAISHRYYLKNSPTKHILDQIKSALPFYLLPLTYKQFYSSEARRVTPDQSPPDDRDIPYIKYATFTKSDIFEGDYIEVLFRISDTGENLENPSGLKIRDHKNRELAVKFIELGFASVSFIADKNEGRHESFLTVTLQDTGSKTNTQSVKFIIKTR